MTDQRTAPSFPLATSSWDAAERAAIQRVIDSDRYTMGPEVRAFEAEFAAHFGAQHAVMVNSGSSANLVAVAAAVLDDGPRGIGGEQVENGLRPHAPCGVGSACTRRGGPREPLGPGRGVPVAGRRGGRRVAGHVVVGHGGTLGDASHSALRSGP